MRWFKPFGIVFLPVTLMGWLATLLPAAFCVQVFLAIDRRSHSVSDTLYGVLPYWACAFLLWTWLASKTSRLP